MTQPYDEAFFQSLPDSARPSAEVLVPLVLELVQPKSVIDVGCGTGTWLSVFEEHGIKDILGVDGDYVNRKMLHIPSDNFRTADLTQPFKIGRTFDLAISLEVGEHLPRQSAEDFVKSLTGLAEVVLFSAAIPYQGGVAHLNEQWPEWWANLFRSQGYVAVDSIRRKIWRDDNPNFWYAQNAFMAVRSERLHKYPILKDEYDICNGVILPIISPYVMENLSWSFDPGKVSVTKASHLLAQVTKNAISRRLNKKGSRQSKG